MLTHQAKKRIAFTLIPMIFVLAVTFCALGLLVYGNLTASTGLDIKLVNGLASLALIVLAIYLAITALVKVRRERGGLVEAPSF